MKIESLSHSYVTITFDFRIRPHKQLMRRIRFTFPALILLLPSLTPLPLAPWHSSPLPPSHLPLVCLLLSLLPIFPSCGLQPLLSPTPLQPPLFLPLSCSSSPFIAWPCIYLHSNRPLISLRRGACVEIVIMEWAWRGRESSPGMLLEGLQA